MHICNLLCSQFELMSQHTERAQLASAYTLHRRRVHVRSNHAYKPVALAFRQLSSHDLNIPSRARSASYSVELGSTIDVSIQACQSWARDVDWVCIHAHIIHHFCGQVHATWDCAHMFTDASAYATERDARRTVCFWARLRLLAYSSGSAFIERAHT